MTELAGIGSMFGLHVVPHPPVRHECREFDERSDHAWCAMCNTLDHLGLYPGHGDLVDEPAVQDAVRELFTEVLEQDFESFHCPFPENGPCPHLRRRSRPPSK